MIFLIPAVFVLLFIPYCCVRILALDDSEAHPTIKAACLLLLSPYVYFIVHTLRINL